MRVALIGYGKMGKAIEQIVLERGHEVSVIIDLSNVEDFESEQFKTSDVAIEFTVPSEALNNYRRCFKYNIPVVSGTTGWLEHFDQVERACKEHGQTFFYASNFSLGVNLFFALNRKLAAMMKGFPAYEVSMTEVHHTQKLDAPSGTATTLASDLLDNLPQYTAWALPEDKGAHDLEITCERVGDVPGIHEVKYHCPEDEIVIRHSAHSRKGFALGAVVAAEYAVKHKGLLNMEKLLSLGSH